MFTQAAAKKTATWLIQGGQVAEDDRVVYEFGLDKLFSSLANFFSAMILGLLFEVPLQAVVFYVAYTMIRVYAGGYHAEKPLTCFFVSIGALVPCLVAIRFYQVWSVPVVFWGLLVVSVVVLVMFGPVEHKNKMLDDVERVVYRHQMLKKMTIVATAAVGLAVFSLNSFSVAVLYGILLAAVATIAGKMKLTLQF